MSILPYHSALDKWRTFKAQSLQVADTLYATSRLLPKGIRESIVGRAFRMSTCSDYIEYRYCQDCGSLHIARTFLCRDRLCPLCTWRLALKRTGEMMHVLTYLYDQNVHLDAAMLTLTIRNCKAEDLSETIDLMLDGWHRIIRRRPVARNIVGYCRSIEITRGTKNTMHPHIHALVFFKQGYDKDIPTSSWASMWRDSIGVDYTPICDIRRSYSKDKPSDVWLQLLNSTMEAIKYTTKGDMLTASSPEDLLYINQAIHGRQLITYGGIIRQARQALRLSDSDTADEISDTTISCPKCDSSNTVLLMYKWAEGSYLLDPLGL